MITTELPLRRLQVIDIITFDEHCKKKVRRVRVRNLRDEGDGTHTIIGVNMQGENPIEYKLPRYPVEHYERRANATYWKPFVDHGEGEE